MIDKVINKNICIYIRTIQNPLYVFSFNPLIIEST